MENIWGPYNEQIVHITNIGNDTMGAQYSPTHNV